MRRNGSWETALCQDWKDLSGVLRLAAQKAWRETDRGVSRVWFQSGESWLKPPLFLGAPTPEKSAR